KTLSLNTAFQCEFSSKVSRRRAEPQEVFIDYLNLTPSEVDNSIPRPVVFEWQTYGARGGVLEIFLDGRPVRRIEVAECRAEVYNLEVGHTYTWRVTNGYDVSVDGRFSIARKLPRWLKIDGASNCRDCGGYRTTGGRYVKQGMLLRGSEFDRHHKLTAEGRRTVLEDIKLALDLDVRGATEVPTGYEPPFGKELKWVNVPLKPYDMITTTEAKACYLAAFRMLTKPENFPAYFHCWGCCDRGGTLAVLLEGLLGIPEADVLADYEYSTCAIYAERKVGFRQFVNLLEYLDSFGGRDLQENVERYFRSAGATDDEFEAFRNIMLE
ncbi:MAG: tyrosine-protein phosphatase, partial [Victivallaceae bacterium]|nr:tyrosine-protein phosphatase [Victivallaceae bacterium]